MLTAIFMKADQMDTSKADAFRGWAKLLHPKALKSNLVTAALFLISYEVLMQSIVKRLKDFCCFGEDGETTGPTYRREVLALHKNKVTASLLWLKGSDAVDDADIALVNQIRKHRNDLAHEMPKFLASSGSEIDVKLLVSMHDLICKIDRWWIREVEIPINPDFAGKEIDDSEIQSGNMIMLSIMLRAAVGDEDKAMKQYETFIEMAERQMAADSQRDGRSE
ncbi:MAG TPA: hypothetical protein VHY91_19390 [Pirellulales bacterium]|nr:hypothetical protein [Pirellulales bacterium]